MNLQIEQFIESIFPTQDPKALALEYAGAVVDPEQAKKDAEARQDIFYMLIAVFSVLFFISLIMVRTQSMAEDEDGEANKRKISLS